MGVHHPWDVSPREAARIQAELRGQVRLEDDFGEIKLVAGGDLSFRRAENLCRAAVVVLSFPQLEPVEAAAIEMPVIFPYVPGLLAFREAPAVISAYERLSTRPDLLILDGHGYAHPRRFGVACHVALVLDTPTIGCAKSKLIGSYADPGPSPGDSSPLTDDGEVIGVALRTRSGGKPVFVSVGHRVSLGSAVRIVMACVRGCRLPEPCRLAHQLAGKWDGSG